MFEYLCMLCVYYLRFVLINLPILSNAGKIEELEENKEEEIQKELK